MKKTLIALTVAASAAVSSSAMAWTANGTGGSVELSGILTPTTAVTPWEVKVGDSVTGLDAAVQKGQKSVSIAVNTTIPFLGIRTVSTDMFDAQTGISPQIDYNGAVDFDAFSCSAPLTLPVVDVDGNEIGSLSTVFQSAAEISWMNKDDTTSKGRKKIYAANAGDAFYGGLGKTEGGVCTYSHSVVKSINPEFIEHYTSIEDGVTEKNTENFTMEGYKYSGIYGAGIPSGKTIELTLNNPVASDVINWKASLPVIVSYQ